MWTGTKRCHDCARAMKLVESYSDDYEFFVYGERSMLNYGPERQRVIQEYVPGKQITLAHLIANPRRDICKKLGLNEETTGAIGILTITPSEAAIIAADVATKSAEVSIGFLDRFSGSLVIVGDVASVHEGLKEIVKVLGEKLKFALPEITSS